MKCVDRWWMPDAETHLPEWMRRVHQIRGGRLTYQLSKYDLAREHCRHRRVAVDVGAHIGLWSRWMAADFETLHAFEPIPDHCACWVKNVPTSPHVTLHPLALGERARIVGCARGVQSTGDTRVLLDGGHDEAFPMARLDDFRLQDVDFIKIDCEGFEYFVLLGAEETVRRWRPVIIVEQKQGHAQRYGVGETEACTLLRHWGAVERAATAGDYVFTFPPEETH